VKTLIYARTALTVPAAWLAVGGSVVYQALLVMLIFIRPELDPSWHSASARAIGPHGWIMSGAFLVSSVSSLSLFVVLRPLSLRGTLHVFRGTAQLVLFPFASLVVGISLGRLNRVSPERSGS